MIRRAGDLYNKPIRAIDDEIGRITEVYFDERSWRIRWLAVDVEDGLAFKRVLIAPGAVASFDGEFLAVQLTKNEIYKSSEESIDTSFEDFDFRIGAEILPPFLAVCGRENGKGARAHFHALGEMSLCSTLTEDGIKGKVEDVLCDDRFWNIRFILVRLCAVSDSEIRMFVVLRVDKIEWNSETVYLACGSDYLSHCPKFDHSIFCNVSYEEFLARYNSASRNVE